MSFVPGTHAIEIKYAEMDITGSPFCVDVFDPSQVRVGCMPQGILGKCFKFDCKSLLFVFNAPHIETKPQ